MVSEPTDVLIAGAGPVGLAMGIEARRHGLSYRIVDEGNGPTVYSKAAAINARTLEVFQRMQVVEEFLAKGKEIHGFNLHAGERRIGHVATSGVESPYQFIMGLSQRETELILDEHLRASGRAVERGVRLTSFTQEGGVVHAELASERGGKELVTARWLCACDGAHSTVRKQLGVEFEGATYEESIVQADLRIDWPMPTVDDEGLIFASPHGIMAALPVYTAGRYRLIVLLSPEDAKARAYENEPLEIETFQRFMDERGPKGARVSDPGWMAAFRFHRRLASHFRVGNVFLIGDAAHIHSPVGGQGMNTGIQDANNLAWKLALVTKGGVPEALLDSYEAERRPVAASILEWTDRATGAAERFLGLRQPLAREIRNDFVEAVTHVAFLRDRLTNIVSETAIDYGASPIVAEYRASFWPFHRHHDGEPDAPTLAGRASFRHGPSAGERLPDVQLEHTAKRTLVERLGGTAHHLLLLAGTHPAESAYRLLERLAEHATSRWRAWIVPHVVVNGSVRPAGLAFRGDVILDAEGAVHRRLGADSECLYLVRPDGYVGYRSQPADEDRLREYVTRVFGAA